MRTTSFHVRFFTGRVLFRLLLVLFRLLLVKLQYSHEKYYFMRMTSFHARDIMSCARHHSACTVSFHVRDIILCA